MAGDRGRGRRGQVPTEEVQHQDCNAQDEMIEDLQRQVAELTQRLAAQDIDDREEEDLAYESSLENPYHRPPHHPRPFHREYRGREESQWSLSFRVDLPEFAGTLHAEGFIDWLDEVERIFDYKEVPNHMKVKIVALKLKGRASAWWEHLKRSRERHGKEKIKDWEKMKKKMRGHFLPFGYKQTLFQRLLVLKQGTRSVDDYTEEFYQLVSRNDLSETEEQLAARYLGGLCQSLQDALSLQVLWMVSEAYQRALVVERKHNRRPLTQNDSNIQTVHTQEHRSTPPSTPGQNPILNIKCFRCGEQGHIATECLKSTIIKGQALFMEEQVEETFVEWGEPIYDEAVEDEDVLYGDGQETLVVRKSLLTPKSDSDDDWLGTNIFSPTCTNTDKVCKMLIDGGSCKNVVYEKTVQKLELNTSRHPKSYKLSWLSKDIEVSVDKHCLISFSIGKKNFDNAWCDVVSMNACHMLLGRPWQYDHNVLHDGRKNTYSLCIKGKNIILAPHREGISPTTKNLTTNLLSMSRFLQKIEHEVMIFALQPCENNRIEENLELPPEAQRLLGSSLSNRPACRLSPKEAEEYMGYYSNNFTDVSPYLSIKMQQLLDEFLELIPKDRPPGLPPEEYILIKYFSHCFRDPDEANVNSRTSSFQPGVTDAGGFSTSNTDSISSGLAAGILIALEFLENIDKCKVGK